MNNRLPYAFTSGDLRPNLTLTFSEGFVAIDAGTARLVLQLGITAAELLDIVDHEVSVVIKRPDGTTITRIADWIDEENYIAEVLWEDGDLQAGLRQICQLVDDDGDLAFASTPPFLLDVLERVA